MKKFERLPLEERKAEIRNAAAVLFTEKGFAATTMENIVERVSLSKGGLYRIYPSTADILGDIIIEGMHMRNDFYRTRVEEIMASGRSAGAGDIVDMICDSMLMDRQVSSLYVEFLWEKRRNPKLAALYDEICKRSFEETRSLIDAMGMGDVFGPEGISLEMITNVMNGMILAIEVLDLREPFRVNREKIASVLAAAVEEE